MTLAELLRAMAIFLLLLAVITVAWFGIDCWSSGLAVALNRGRIETSVISGIGGGLLLGIAYLMDRPKRSSRPPGD